MSVSTLIVRLREYRRRHGFSGTIRRIGLAMKRELFANRMVVFYCDLAPQTLPTSTISGPLKVNRLNSEAELSQQDLEPMTSIWNPRLALRNIRERFAKGASLWLIKSGNQLAGYGWTLRGRTIEPYYFPLRPEDAHLFDFHVFSQYRGQGVNPLLVEYILRSLGIERGGRAFIEAAEWNEAQLSSLRKTPFRRLGVARSLSVFGHKFTSWTQDEHT
jgi:ribosomal protein S18 acetylase RimI-like enzyme